MQRVLFSDKAIGQKAPLIERLRQKGVDVTWREDVENAVVCEEVAYNLEALARARAEKHTRLCR